MADQAVEIHEDKPDHRGSSTESTSKGFKAQYTVDGVDDTEAAEDVYSRANPSRPGFTKFDQKDMYRMGKIQEFKVSAEAVQSEILDGGPDAVTEFLNSEIIARSLR